ncbi:hypothetical protein BD779DRAFT_1613016 [Infundibulicybe gibba]|nr:hypothetical protein BD779DRAFT_1613016 [Infundibulicybe gibba]
MHQSYITGYGRGVARNFNNSIYPAITFNCGPKTECREHVDHGNASNMLCAITALGEFDHTRGGHLVLFPLKLAIQFPPGATILIPSACLAHGNTTLQPGETRQSITQYCAGGLIRWVDYGFCSAKDFLLKEGAAEKMEIDKAPGVRWLGLLDLFSTIEDIPAV